ncbi:MAG: nicotinate-nucleotide diphosphorylase, partial [Candidatus Binatia bacterium]
ECDTLEQVDEALGAGADAILLDNMDVSSLRRAVSRIRKRSPRAQIEASGGVTLERVRAIAETGVDWISVGALTHSAPAVDLTLHLSPRHRKSLRAKKFRVSKTSTKR